jgi:hypothetical protein
MTQRVAPSQFPTSQLSALVSKTWEYKCQVGRLSGQNRIFGDYFRIGGHPPSAHAMLRKRLIDRAQTGKRDRSNCLNDY